MALIECRRCHKIFNMQKGKCPLCQWEIGTPIDVTVLEKTPVHTKLKSKSIPASEKEPVEFNSTPFGAQKEFKTSRRLCEMTVISTTNVMAPSFTKPGCVCELLNGRIRVGDKVEVIRRGELIYAGNVEIMMSDGAFRTEMRKVNTRVEIVLGGFRDYMPGDEIFAYENSQSKDRKDETEAGAKNGFITPEDLDKTRDIRPKKTSNFKQSSTGVPTLEHPKKKLADSLNYQGSFEDLVDVVMSPPKPISEQSRRTPVSESVVEGVYYEGVHAGCKLKAGKLSVDDIVQVCRDNKVIHEGRITLLMHYKNHLTEVEQYNWIFGIRIEGFSDFRKKDKLFSFRSSQ